MHARVALIVVLCHAISAVADVVKMRGGSEFECVVVQENSDSIVVRRGYGTMLLPRAAIASVTKSSVITPDVAPATRPVSGQRIPPWSSVVAAAAKEKWATGLQQIPATVIDVGVMKNVPYQSFRCGTDYEINIYGDPDNPAAIEVGIYRTLLSSADAKRNCVEFIASILWDKVDAAIVRSLDRSKDLVTRNDLTTEITPPTSPDAYGGWWVSAYGEKQLDLARATDVELDQIAVPRTPELVVARATPTARPIATPAPSPSARAPVRPAPAVVQSEPDPFNAWTSVDLARARPSVSSTASSGGGRVYVRGYYRSNGTYVRPHTRQR